MSRVFPEHREGRARNKRVATLGLSSFPAGSIAANSNFGSSSQPDTWQPLGVAALNALSRLIGGRDA